MAQVGMVPLDPGPIPIQYKTNLRRVSSRLALGDHAVRPKFEIVSKSHGQGCGAQALI